MSGGSNPQAEGNTSLRQGGTMPDSDDSSEDFCLEEIFGATELRCSPTKQTRTLHREGGWSVTERRKGGVMTRWLVHEDAPSLDQSRVELSYDEGQGREVFNRRKLTALHLQAMAMVAALVPDGPPGGLPRICVLGGGGMVLPMALVEAHEELEVLVLEQDGIAINLAQRFFGLPSEPAGRLRVKEADGLAFITDGRLSGANALLIDVDFLRTSPPAAFLSPDLWRSAWRSLGTGGVIVLNALGASDQRLESLAELITSEYQGRRSELAVGVLEPSAELDKSASWTPFRPRPGLLVLGPLEHIGVLRGGDDLESAMNGRAHWAAALAAQAVRELLAGIGLLAKWRPIAPSGGPSGADEGRG
mmetsp:Transcript_11716/g.26137  ORF Transcript_11716/g.26137 Transcript_11716/m.26137 type:complete len:361 (-) Transcript_11716:70-1152(-)